jgi:hypothetical protein
MMKWEIEWIPVLGDSKDTARLKDLLEAGWEPFAVTGQMALTLWLRRKVVGK